VALFSKTTQIPLWPFLVANHELGRVDYRTLIAPDFMTEQGCGELLATLPLSSNESALHLCTLHYHLPRGQRCRVVALYQLRPLPAGGYFPVQPQREVQVILGLVLLQSLGERGIDPRLLGESFTLYEDYYRAFCRSYQPRDFPVIPSWPLAAPLSHPLSLTRMPDQTALQPPAAPHSLWALAVLPTQRLQRSHPITRKQVLARIRQRPRIFQLLRIFPFPPLFRWHWRS
jgi:hypothetical protein